MRFVSISGTRFLMDGLDEFPVAAGRGILTHPHADGDVVEEEVEVILHRDGSCSLHGNGASCHPRDPRTLRVVECYIPVVPTDAGGDMRGPLPHSLVYEINNT